MHSSYWTEFLDAEVVRLAGRHRSRVLLAGSGAPVLLLHGTGGHIENYARNIMALARRRRVVAMDFLWHGGSACPDLTPAVIPALVDQVCDVLDTLGIARADLVGQSLGGWVALRAALRHPGRVGRLVLVTAQGYRPDAGSVPGYVEPDGQALQNANLATLRDPSFENVRSRLGRVLAHPDILPDEAVAVRHKFYNDPEVNRAQQAFMAVYPTGAALQEQVLTDADLANIAAPTLVYWGDSNPVPAAVGRRLAEQLPNGRFHCAAETGHMAQFESAPEFNRVVAEFLG